MTYICDMSNGMNRIVSEMMQESVLKAKQFGAPKLMLEHIILTIIEFEITEATTFLSENGVDINSLHDFCYNNALLNQSPLTVKHVIPDDNVREVFAHTHELVNELGLEFGSFPHIITSILRFDSPVSKFLKNFNINYNNMKEKLGGTSHEVKSSIEEPNDGSGSKKRRRNRNVTKEGGVKTPILDSLCRNITNLAKEQKINPVIGRDVEINEIITILARRRKHNPIIVGPAGCGKSAIVEGLALKIVDGTAPRTLLGKEIYSMDVSNMVAGTKYRGQFEERIQGLLKELEDNDDIILFIDEIHTIVGAGSTSGSLDAANILKPALARGEIKVIGATTLDEYRENIEKDAALTRRFQKVQIDEPSVDEAIFILNNIKPKYEDFHAVTYTDEAIEECVKLSHRYLTDRHLPDKAIDLLDESGAKASINVPTPKNILNLEEEIREVNEEKLKVVKSQQYEKAASLRDKESKLKSNVAKLRKDWELKLKSNRRIVDGEKIREIVSQISGIPVTKMGVSENKQISNLDKLLKMDVIGQDEAIDKIVSAIKVGRIGIGNPNKPVGSFMLIGSTGVGKTQVAKMLAKHMFNDESALIRVDMSEYNESFSVSKLVGAPPGYVGYESGGDLTEKVRRKPYSVVLFDEIEKAHPDVFNMMLQIMDDGYIKDSLGREINFKNTIILMTSNTGVRKAMDAPTSVGFETSSRVADEDNRVREIIEKEMKGVFAPEFINRIDEIVFFNSLKKDDISKIVVNEVRMVTERLADKGFQIKVNPSAINFLVEEGFDSEFGARPIKRAINRYLEVALAEKIIDGEFSTDKVIKITHSKDSDKLSFKQ